MPGEKYSLQQWLEETYFDSDKATDLTHEDITKLGDLLNRLLRFCPFERSPAADILMDKWFQEVK